VTAPGTPGSAALVRLVAGREVSTRIRDKTFLISSAVILLLVLGAVAFQVVIASGAGRVTVGVVGDRSALQPALQAEGKAVGADVTVVGLAGEAAARTALAAGDVDGALVLGSGGAPRLLVERKADPMLTATVQGAVGQLAIGRQLAQAGINPLDVPQVGVTVVNPGTDPTGERTGIAIVGIIVLYTLLILMGQFVAQGVVEEKSTRVVELLLATMRPWQLLAGKIIGLGLLGLAQIVAISVVGVTGALAFGVVSLPGQLIGTVLTVVAWFVLGYAFYAAAYAAAGALVPRQEEIQSTTTPLTMLILVSLFAGFAVNDNPDGTLGHITAFIPPMAPVTMPSRIILGAAPAWEIVASAAVTILATVILIPIAGRIYAAVILRTGSTVKFREAARLARAPDIP
jgi:ABC-2 type transport system permease protein